MIWEATIEAGIDWGAILGIVYPPAIAIVASIVTFFLTRKKYIAEVGATNANTEGAIADKAFDLTGRFEGMIQGYISKLETRVKELEAKKAEQDASIDELKKTVHKHEGRIQELEGDLLDNKGELERKEEKIHEVNERNKLLDTQIDWLRSQLSEAKQKEFLEQFGN